MVLDRLWNGWRSQYVTSFNDRPATGSGSVFSQILASGVSDDEAFVVRRFQRVFVIMNAFPYTSGHCMVLPYREVPSLEDLDADEATDLWSTVTDAVQAIKTAYRPGGINVGINLGTPAGGSISEHLHVHVVPRWSGDGNFMTAVANTRTLPEPLDQSMRKLRDAWPVR